MSLDNPASIVTSTAGNPVNVLNDGTNYRLAVDTRPTLGVSVNQPAYGTGNGAKTVFYWLTTTGGSGGSNNLLVNGSTTASTFYFSPKVATLSVYYIRILMGAASYAFSGASFGGSGTGGLLGSNNPAALTKGLLVQTVSAGVTSTLVTMLTNEDMFALNGGARAENAGAGIMLVGDIFLNQQLIVNTTDAVSVTIQDNMTGRNLTSMRACFCGVRV